MARASHPFLAKLPITCESGFSPVTICVDDSDDHNNDDDSDHHNNDDDDDDDDDDACYMILPNPVMRTFCAQVLSLRYGVFAAEPDYYVCYAAERKHSNLFSNLVVFLSPRSGHATEQASKSSGTLATEFQDSTEKLQIVDQDEHHCCRALLPASYAMVRSGSNGKQQWQP